MDAVPEVRTPLGVITLTAQTENWASSDSHPNEVFSLPNDSRLFRWATAGLEIELLLCTLVPVLPNGMKVESCQAAMWRAWTTLEMRDNIRIDSRVVGCLSINGKMEVPSRAKVSSVKPGTTGR